MKKLGLITVRIHLSCNYQRTGLLTYNTKSSEFTEMGMDILSEAACRAIGLFLKKWKIP